jgi:hypothetical protein
MLSGMSPDYSSMWAKLGRAEELLNRLDAEVAAFHAGDAYGFDILPNDDHTCQSIFIKINENAKIRWSLLFSDFIHNLRCVLDHLAWAIAVHYDPSLPTKNDTILSFPIWENMPNANERRRIKPIKSNTVRDAIEFMQPFNRPSPIYHPYHPLLMLRDLDNANKHKLLYLTQPRIWKIDVQVCATASLHEKQPEMAYFKGEIKHGMEILRVTFPRPHPEAKVNFRIGIILGVNHKITSATGKNLDDYSRLGETLVAEVVDVIGAITSAVH